MGDLRRTGLMNQKREAHAGVFSLVEADIITAAVAANTTTGQIAVAANTALVAVLPERVLITGIRTIVTTASTTVGAQLSIQVNGVNIATNVAVATTGTKISTPLAAASYFATGGQVTVTPGTTPPATGTLVCEVIVEYIELDVTEDYIGLMG